MLLGNMGSWVESAPALRAQELSLEYYVIGSDGASFGPANVDLLNQWAAQGRVTNETVVVEVGSGNRIPITSVPGFTKAPPMASPTYGYERQTYVGAPAAPVHVENHLVKAIISTLCCCLPLGVVAIVYASQVDGHARRGDIQAAEDASEKASTWANWSIGLAVFGILIRIMALANGVPPGSTRYR